MNKKWRIAHYVNQFFGQVGGEEQAFIKPSTVAGPVGPGLLLSNQLGENFEVVVTVICGDNYIAENTEKAVSEILALLDEYSIDAFIAGPAFNAGRYGPACGAVCKAIGEKYNIPVVTGMYEENPGVEMYRKNCYIIKTKDSAAGMRKDMKNITNLVKKIMSGEELKSPEEEFYFVKGYKKNIFVNKTGAVRAIDMLMAKLSGETFKSEIVPPAFEQIKPAKNIKNASESCVAMVTEGGLVDINNVNGLESARATKYLEFDITGMDRLSENEFCTIHGGFDNTYGNKNPNVILPVDILRELEKEKVIGALYNKIYSTSGNGTSLKNSQSFGAEIANRLKSNGVNAVILTST